MSRALNHETVDYYLDIQPAIYGDFAKGEPVYVLVNKVTGLREAEGLSYPDALLCLYQRQQQLNEVREYINSKPESPFDEVTEVH